MRVGARYSHLNGEEFLIVHRKALCGLNILRQGRGIPAVPLVLVGVSP